MPRQDTTSDPSSGSDRGSGGRSPQQDRKRSRSSGKARPASPASPRDATGINPEKRKPIDPKSVYIPPA